MATSPCRLPCTFAGTQENMFYFQVGEDETDLQRDTFFKSTTSSVHWLKNKDNLFLYLAGGDQLVFEDLTQQQRCRPDCKFTVQPFNEHPDNPLHPENRGRAVTLSAVVDERYKVVSCGETYEIKVETMDSLPDIIADDCLAALFFMRNCNPYNESYFFQSAVYKTHVLGFEQVPGVDNSMHKLVLRPLPKEEVDDGCLIDVPPCQQI